MIPSQNWSSVLWYRHIRWRTFPLQVMLQVALVMLGACSLSVDAANAQSTEVPQRCFAIELYVHGGPETSMACVDAVRAATAAHRGMKLKVHHVIADSDVGKEAMERLAKIAKIYQLPAGDSPVLYGLNRALSVPAGSEADEKVWADRLAELARVEIFTRPGCSRCTEAKAYLPAFRTTYPALRITTHDVLADPASNARFSQIARQQKIGGVSFPGFWLAQQLVIGFESRSIGAGRLDAVLRKWSFECKLASTDARRQLGVDPFAVMLVSTRQAVDRDGPAVAFLETVSDADGPSLPIAADDETFSLDIENPAGSTSQLDITEQEADERNAVDLPWIGQVSADRLGMPLFTLIIGLVDGFNPCAMWVLLFLLSVLVNLKDRWKIVAVAGTFVVISGAVYFAFMTAWLNVLLLVGFLRWVQVTLAILAIVIGSIHVKDFFAFKRGISLSIPESAKPGLYARVRRIVMAESLFSAIAGASVLAILVNVIELLCTAGLPALYSQILMMQDFPAWKNYAYLFLYVLAYMFDDTIMVTIVVVTLGKRKLQEHEGRWLKLISGLVILLLGIVLLFRPQWLGA